MYCYHCAKRINEDKIEAKQSSFALPDGSMPISEDATVSYVCPRCGHLIHYGASEEEVKSLARAAHAQIQRARNFLSSGLGLAAVGVIILIIAVLFYFLACKPTNQYQLVVTCAEFYVSVILGTISVILLTLGTVNIVRGILRRKANKDLLRDINNQTFVQ